MHYWRLKPDLKPNQVTNCIGGWLLKKTNCLWGIDVQKYWIRSYQHQQTDGGIGYPKRCRNIGLITSK